MDPEEAAGLRAKTKAALAEVDSILRGLDATAAEAESDSVSLVRSLGDESRKALAAGDLERAENLADKALALARDLPRGPR
jgi:hypothetical protein